MRTKKILVWLAAGAMSLSVFGVLSITGFATSGTAGTADELESALGNAQSGDTVTLVADIALSSAITIPNGVTVDAGEYNIILPIDKDVAVTTDSDDNSLNKVLKAESVEIDPSDTYEVLVAYTDDGSSRVYSASNVLGSNEGGNGIYNIYMGGRAVVVNQQDGTDTETDLKLTYTENGTEYNALYNTAKHTNGNDLPARIFGGLEKPTEYADNYANMLGLSVADVTEYKLKLESGKVESLRGSNKNKAGATVDKITIEVTGGKADVVASGWYYLESVKEYNVTISDGTVGAVYGNGQTSYTASDNMDDPNFVPTVDTANIDISGGTVDFVYGSGWALTQSGNSANRSMLTKQANITVTGGDIGYVNGGGFSGPEANWGESSGQDMVTVSNAVINVSGGTIDNLFAGGYNGQWRYTYKLNADGELVFSNYNGTDETTRTVRNIVTNSTINVETGANIAELYLGGRSYSYVGNTTLEMNGGHVGTLAASGSYGYTENSTARISGGTVDKLELVHRNYVGNIDIDVTGGTVQEFYAGTGGAYKNANLNEQTYNISTIAILGDVNVDFASGYEPAYSYLTTGLERASRVDINVPVTVHTMDLVGGDYTGEITETGNFVGVNTDAAWSATVVLASDSESYTPASASSMPTAIIPASTISDMTVTEADGKYILTVLEGVSVSTGNAIVRVGTDNSEATGFVTTVTGTGLSSIRWDVTSGTDTGTTDDYTIPTAEGTVRIGIIINGLNDGNATAKATVTASSNEYAEQ